MLYLAIDQHRKQLTINLRNKNWTEVLGSERLTDTALDRLTHRCQIIETTGESYRLKDAPTSASQEDQGVIIDLSGKVCYNSRTHLAPHFSTANRFNFQLRFTYYQVSQTLGTLVHIRRVRFVSANLASPCFCWQLSLAFCIFRVRRDAGKHATYKASRRL